MTRPASRSPSRLVVSNLDDKPVYVKSTRTNGQGQCVEVATDIQRVLVRDSKDRTGPALPFGAAAWAAFTTAVKAGDLPLT